MTIREWAEQYCRERGMFPGQAKSVADALVADEVEGAMAGRWDDQVDDYPPRMLVLVAARLDRKAVEWIDANLPEAWYRPIFAGEAPGS